MILNAGSFPPPINLLPPPTQGIAVLACCASHIHEALMAAVAFGATHVNLDGTLIRTDRLARKGSNGADLWWNEKHKCHGGNIQILCLPGGFPTWVSEVREQHAPGIPRSTARFSTPKTSPSTSPTTRTPTRQRSNQRVKSRQALTENGSMICGTPVRR